MSALQSQATDSGPDESGQDAPLGTLEGLAAGVLFAIGLALAASWSVYDAWTWQVAVSLTIVNVGIAGALFWLGLGALRAAPGRRAAAALWAALAWNVFPASQIAYVGFLFVPIEIIATAVILQRRTHLPRKAALLLLAAGVRLAAFAGMHAARPAMHQLFPWR
jgi:hypothetical protein